MSLDFDPSEDLAECVDGLATVSLPIVLKPDSGERGFRVVNYTVESDAASPRLCVQFSEALKRGSFDFSRFISVDGKDGT